MDLAPGTILLGKYRVEELIGTGGMSKVVRVSHLYLQQSVALKILLPTLAEDPSTVQRFLREAQATVKLRSEHIARVSDVGTLPDGAPFMEMEYLDGNDLNQILRHHGPQMPAIVCDLMLQACEGLSEAHHAGIVHRDVKPSNFFITRRPDGSMLLKILDFGISKTPVGYEGELTGTQTVIGTPTYMAPEQMKNGRSADPRSDIWSLGVVMYQLINGRPPFAGESYAELVLKVGAEAPMPMHVQIPQGLHDVIYRCLEKDPNRRHKNVAELSRLLAPYATDPHAGAQSASRTARILMGSRIHNQALALTANGGMTAPLSPAQLTPKSWQQASSSSASHGRGQMTYQVGPSPKRGLWIAGAAGLALGTGVGGFLLSRQMGNDKAGKEGKPEPTAAAKAPTPTPTPTPDPPKPAAPKVAADPGITTPPPLPTVDKPPEPTFIAKQPPPPPPPTPTVPTVPTIATKPAEPPPTIAPKPPEPAHVAPPAAKPPVAAKPVVKPAVVAATKPAATPPPKPVTAPAKPTPKPAAKPKHDDDLFNSRK